MKEGEQSKKRAVDAVIGSFGILGSDDERREAAVGAIKNLDVKTQEAIALELGMQLPSPKTADKLWWVVILIISAVLLASSMGVAYAVIFMGKTADDMQVVLTVFFSTMSFITGVFVPSPTQKGQR